MSSHDRTGVKLRQLDLFQSWRCISSKELSQFCGPIGFFIPEELKKPFGCPTLVSLWWPVCTENFDSVQELKSSECTQNITRIDGWFGTCWTRFCAFHSHSYLLLIWFSYHPILVCSILSLCWSLGFGPSWDTQYHQSGEQHWKPFSHCYLDLSR